MVSRNLASRTANLAMAACALAGSGACDVPTEAVPIVESLADSEPDLDELYIEAIATNGQGCPAQDPHTVTTVISADKKSFVIIYQDMELINPPGPKVKNLSCQAAVQLHIPSGYQATLATVNTRGYLYLDKQIKATETSSYFFAGIPHGIYPHTTIEGPYDGPFEFSDEIPVESLVWSDCGTSAIFGIKTTLNLNAKNNPNGQAIFSNDTTDGVFKTILHWQLKPC